MSELIKATGISEGGDIAWVQIDWWKVYKKKLDPQQSTSVTLPILTEHALFLLGGLDPNGTWTQEHWASGIKYK